MSDSARKSPATRAGVDRAMKQNQHPQSIKKAPPFARRLRTGGSLFVCTGSDAWNWARDVSWMPYSKVILPPGDHPDSYRWQCAQSFVDAVIVAAGHPPPFDIIAALAAALLAYLDLVIYLDPDGQAMRLKPAQRAT